MVHKHGMAGICACLLVAFCAVGPAQAADWPQFLGSDRNGVASDASGLARSWPDDGPKVLWQTPTGEGFGGACVYGDSVLLLDRKVGEKDILRHIRLADGEEVWRSAYDAPGKLNHQGSRSTPATDGDLVFTVGTHGHIRAVKFADGSVVWSAHLLNDWGAKLPNWGVATSPLLLDHKVIVSPWGSKAALVAYNKADGKVVWQTPNPSGKGHDYSSPVRMTLGGKTMIVATGKNGSHTIGVDAETGKQLWLYNGYSCGIHIPSPTILEDGRVLLTGGYGAGSAMFKVEAQENGFKVDELWKTKAFGSTISQAVIHDGHIYLNKGYKQSVHGMACATLDGTPKWETGRSPGFDMGPVFLADGLIFAINGNGGDLVMVAPDPNGYKELGRASVLSGQKVWAPMAFSNGKLIVRDHSKLVCVELKE